MMRRKREQARERLRPLAVAFIESEGEIRPKLHGRDAIVFADLLDEISLERARRPEPEPEPEPPAEVPPLAVAGPAPAPERSAEPADAVPPPPRFDDAELELRASVLSKRELALARLHETLAEREREFDDRAREVKEAERRLARTAAELHERAALLDKREVALAARERQLASAGGGETAGGAQPGMWDLETLERLVDHSGDRHADRIDEWRYYLLYLRGHASPDGRLPASFDWLVAEVFAELLEPAARVT
jgi:hypothetical protein